MPSVTAISRCNNPSARSLKTLRTWASENFARLWSAPRSGFRCSGARPFETISRKLSRFVPRNRCSGLMHRRTSHLWSTQSPSGIGPRASTHATLCAPRSPNAAQFPYPITGDTGPVHRRHPEGCTSDRAQNLESVSFGLIGPFRALSFPAHTSGQAPGLHQVHHQRCTMFRLLAALQYGSRLSARLARRARRCRPRRLQSRRVPHGSLNPFGAHAEVFEKILKVNLQCEPYELVE